MSCPDAEKVCSRPKQCHTCQDNMLVITFSCHAVHEKAWNISFRLRLSEGFKQGIPRFPLVRWRFGYHTSKSIQNWRGSLTRGKEVEVYQDNKEFSHHEKWKQGFPSKQVTLFLGTYIEFLLIDLHQFGHDIPRLASVLLDPLRKCLSTCLPHGFLIVDDIFNQHRTDIWLQLQPHRLPQPKGSKGSETAICHLTFGQV